MALTAVIAPHYSASAQPVVTYSGPEYSEDTQVNIDSERSGNKNDAEQDFRSRGGRSERNFEAYNKRIQASITRHSARVDEFKNSMETAAQAYGIGTCYGNQVSYLRSDVREAAEKSTVAIIMSYKGNVQSIGTGFVVFDSAVAGGMNRIVTAGHVVSPGDVINMMRASTENIGKSVKAKYPNLLINDAIKKIRADSSDMPSFMKEVYLKNLDSYVEYLDAAAHPENFKITVFSSPAKKLGEFKVVAHGKNLNEPTPVVDMVDMPTPDGKFIQTSVYSRVNIDWAVIEALPGRATADYSSITGLRLTPVQMNEKTFGMSGGMTPAGLRAGVSSGFSGGPAFDNLGYVHGVVSTGMNITESVPIKGMKVMVNTPIKDNMLGMSQEMGLNPLGAPALLAALGNAGLNVSESNNSPMLGTKLTVLGNPGGQCASSVTAQGKFEIGHVTAMSESPRSKMLPGMTSPPQANAKFISNNGDIHTYDGEAMRVSTLKKNGDTVSYYNEQVVRIDFVNGSWTEFEGGHISLKGTKDGTLVGYDTMNMNGKSVDLPVVRISPNGEVTALLPQGRSHKMYPAYDTYVSPTQKM